MGDARFASACLAVGEDRSIVSLERGGHHSLCSGFVNKFLGVLHAVDVVERELVARMEAVSEGVLSIEVLTQRNFIMRRVQSRNALEVLATGLASRRRSAASERCEVGVSAGRQLSRQRRPHADHNLEVCTAA